jgi:hypothetical protein
MESPEPQGYSLQSIKAIFRIDTLENRYLHILFWSIDSLGYHLITPR